MFKVLILAICSFLIVTNASAASNTTELFLLDKDGKQVKSVGTVKFKESKKGLEIITHLTGLPAGEHGFHIHENPSCEPSMKDGKIVPAGKAGGHYDPAKTGSHEGPKGKGHLGDLPKVTFDAKGTSKQVLYAPRVKMSDVKNKAIMIHVGGDNYSDQPAPLGGGGPRMVCGITK